MLQSSWACKKKLRGQTGFSNVSNHLKERPLKKKEEMSDSVFVMLCHIWTEKCTFQTALFTYFGQENLLGFPHVSTMKPLLGTRWNWTQYFFLVLGLLSTGSESKGSPGWPSYCGNVTPRTVSCRTGKTFSISRVSRASAVMTGNRIL